MSSVQERTIFSTCLLRFVQFICNEDIESSYAFMFVDSCIPPGRCSTGNTGRANYTNHAHPALHSMHAKCA